MSGFCANVRDTRAQTCLHPWTAEQNVIHFRSQIREICVLRDCIWPELPVEEMSSLCVCVCVCAIEMDCFIMHSPPDHKQGSQHSHEQPVSQLELWLHVGTFLLSALYLLVQKPQHTQKPQAPWRHWCRYSTFRTVNIIYYSQRRWFSCDHYNVFTDKTKQLPHYNIKGGFIPCVEAINLIGLIQCPPYFLL